jgi:Tol biopolymer transport system component
VLDFRLTADGSALVYAVLEAAGQDAVHLRDLATGADRVLYACSTGQVCRDGALSPDGRWLAFEREDQGPEGAPAGAVVPQVFLVAVGQDDEAFPIAAADHSTSSPSWSSRGWLEYYDHTLQAYAFVAHPTSPEQPADRYVPNALGDRGVWSPDGESFVFPEIVFVASAEDDERPPLYYSHLYRLNVVSGAILDLSGETVSLVEDTGPAYSPDGLWLAFSRKYLDPGRWTLGHQIWRMRSDGLTPEALTDVPARNHSALTWSPDGRYLAYMEFDQVDMTKAAEIWWMALDGSASGSLASGGYAPQWSP